MFITLKNALIGFLAVAMVGPALAQDVSKLPYEHIADYQSQSGESLTVFLERVRPDMRAFSSKTGFESCGAIAQNADGSQFGLVLGSSDGHMGCAVYNDKVPAGMTSTGVTIHSHGRDGVFKVNKSDIAMMSPEDAGRLATARRTTFGGQNLFHFSPTDYAGGPGYLATPTGLAYQDGVGTDRTIAVSDPSIRLASAH